MNMIRKLTGWLSREKPAPVPIAMPPGIAEMFKAMVEAHLARQATAQAGIKPPPDPAVDQPMSWSLWVKLMDENTLPGWTPCRYATRGELTDTAKFVFGSVRGPYGIHTQAFPTCEPDGSHSQAVLACLIYLPSGLGFGIFADRETAGMAADLIGDSLEGAGPVEETDESLTRWREHMRMVWQKWEFHGIDHAKDRHAHNGRDHSGEFIPIYTKTDEAVLFGKPEKLT